ncbi:hypothetical protein [Caldanaerobacter subterraneus]|uniref:hypothetical protein n=1 Tax=Caldanaerobacter subterraneus TaxID=911092 RepID=UPI0034646031
MLKRIAYGVCCKIKIDKVKKSPTLATQRFPNLQRSLQAPLKTLILLVRDNLTTREDRRMFTITQIDDIRKALFFNF